MGSETLRKMEVLLASWQRVGRTPRGHPVPDKAPRGDPAWCPPELWALLRRYGFDPVVEALLTVAKESAN